MKLNILSDLHLSCGLLEIPQTDADVVILAGDIGRPGPAIEWASGFDKPVLYVPGNHEFYGGSLAGTVSELKRLCQGTQIQVLDSEAVVINGVRFLGTTLWTDFLLFGLGEERTAAMAQAQHLLRDFKKIRVNEDALPEQLFTAAASAELCQAQADWLAGQLASPHAGPTVVITHHAPSPQSIHPRFAGSLLNACFVSNLEHLAQAGSPQLWVHGHAHDGFDYRIGPTRVVSNPRGYASEGVNENLAFDSGFVVELAAHN